MLVNEFLELSTEKYPDKTALVCGDIRLTFSEVEDRANRLSCAFSNEGLLKQERVAVYLESSIESVISIFAILKASGVFLVINPQIKAEKAKYILNDCQVKILITDRRHFKEIINVLPDCPHLTSIFITDYESLEKKTFKKITPRIISYSETLDSSSSNRPNHRCIDIDLASLIYTSGSTGIPKGVMCTHIMMVTAASSIIEYLENSSGDILLDVLPLSFDYGLYQVLMSFKFGGTVILERSFLYPYKTIDTIIKERVTGFPIVPTIAAILLKLKNLDKHDFSSLRYITNTAQALPTEHIIRLQRLFPDVKIFSMYGLTECKRVSYLPPDELKRIPASVGKAMPNTEVYLVDYQGKKITKPETVGELVVRGANVMKGYWNLPEETNKVLKPGPYPGEKVLYTGDLFKMDEDGFLYFISRKDDLIKTAGERVSPKEIENVLHKINEVSEAAVIGVEDEILGQAIKAFVVLKKDSNLQAKEIAKYCAQHVENFMIPKYIEILEELPKSSHGKVSKKELR